MISAATTAALNRLAQGKRSLSRAQMQLVLEEIARTPRDVLLKAAFPEPAAAARPAPPDWLAAMQAAQRKLAWRAQEATDQLYALARDLGYRPTGPRKRSFSGAARAIADELGAERTRDMFVAWINDQIATRRLI